MSKILSYLYSFFYTTPEAPTAEIPECLLDDDDEFDVNTRIQIKTNDGKIFELGYEVIRECQLLKDVLHHTGDTQDDPIPIPNVDSKRMKTVIQFCGFFKLEKKYVVPFDSLECQEAENKEAFAMLRKFNCADALLLIQAADYLDCPRLYDYMAFYVLEKIKGKSVRAMQSFFDVDDKGPKYSKEKRLPKDQRVVKMV
uniref:Skp1_POZ domain-containing protein n=1 Tax=Panagrellus redivivus TaxID=6233 RepID=A0A7E4ZYQ4_PANRE